MEIRNLINQYYGNVNNNASQAMQPQGVEQLTQALAALKEGVVFEGTVNNISGSEVLLGLSSGQNITARLLADVGLTVGESVFFQVKKNDGQEITIKPVSVGASSGNPIISDALKSASLPVTDQTIEMVDEMIRNHMSIDSKSVSEMGRSVLMNPTADPKSVVVLKNLGLPVNGDTLTQLGNYSEGRESVFSEISSLSDVIADIVTDEPESFNGMADIITNVYLDGNDGISQEVLAKDIGVSVPEDNLADEGFEMPQMSKTVTEEAEKNATTVSDKMPVAVSFDREEMPEGTVGNTLDAKGFQKIADFSESSELMKENFPGLFDEKGHLKPEAKTSDVFNAMKWTFEQNGGEFTAKNIKSSGMPDLIRGIIEDRYSLTPEEIVKKGRVNESYNDIQKDMSEIAKQAADRFPESIASKISQAAGSVNGNVSFVKEVNTIYNFVQIPLKLSNQNATGSLYVYSNKKKKKWNPDEPITAFLHFDLESLGSTDISIRLLKKNLDTRFSLADDVSYQLIENNVHILKEKLESMGFNCNVSVTEEDVKRNFVDDFLKQDIKKTSINGKQILRYSFDVRA